MSVASPYRRQPLPSYPSSYSFQPSAMRQAPLPASQTTSSNAGQARSHLPYKNSATRTTHASHLALHGRSTSSTASSYLTMGNSTYKVEREQGQDGKQREVIVIEDTPDPSHNEDEDDVSNASKRRRVNGITSNYEATYPSASTSKPAYYPSHAYRYKAPAAVPATIDRTVAASGVGGKRKAQDIPTGPRKKAEVQQSCDDKEGHFIVRPNEFLENGRYRIEKLLGQGTFGKVVEAYDSETDRWVAIKIIRSIQKYRDASKVEIKVLNLLRQRDPRNTNNCIHLIDYFDDRNHICIVTELLSTSVFDFLKGNGYAPFPQSQIQTFAKQLLSSVAFLHDLHLIHTDLKPENILLVDNTSRPSPTKTHKDRRILTCSDIRLIDFGSATFEEEYHASVVSTRHYRAPEIIIGLGWSYPCDAWSIGCILVEFFTGDALFQTHDNLEHLAMMEVVFGRMPDRFARLASRSKPEWFKGTRLDFPKPDTPRQSRKYVKGMKSLKDIVNPNGIVTTRFLDLLSKLLAWDPNERISVRKALQHPFFALNIQDEAVTQA